MDYASIGRRKLEELRQQKSRIQKKATEAEDPDADGSPIREELERVLKERDVLRKQVEGSLDQVQLLRNQLQDSRAQADNNDRIVAELKQSVKALSIERDAAVNAKEDLLAQLRMTRKRLQEAEDEQYKAEEDAATLRAELQHLRLQDARTSDLMTPEPHNFAAQEISSMKLELQNAHSQLQGERERVAMEERRAAKLAAEKEQLELALAQSKAAAAKAANGSNRWKSEVDGGIYEQHLRELASMVERLERGRQKLLSEIDGQSLEIERLFMENDGLLQGLNEARELAAQWEHQLHESMKQNVQLGEMLNALRMSSGSAEPEAVSDFGIGAMKVELANAIAQRDELSLRVSQLSVELASAQHSVNSINRLYKPVLANIESRLLQVKHSSFPVEVA